MSYNRVAVIERLRQIADAATADNVGCFFADPGDALTELALWFGGADGPTDTESMGTDPRRRDNFTVPVYILAFVGDMDPAVAAGRAEAILNDFSDLLAKCQRMRNDDLLSAGDHDAYSTIYATPKPTNVNGPIPLVLFPTEQALPAWGISFELPCSVLHQPTT